MGWAERINGERGGQWDGRPGKALFGEKRKHMNMVYRKRGRKKILLAAVMAAVSVLLAACGRDGTRVVFTAGPQEDEVFLINAEACKLPELMVLLTTTQNQYENVYGEEIWNASHEGVTLEENVKETVLARLAQIKTMYLLALEQGVELTEEETQRIDAAAEEYFASLNEEEIGLMGVTLDTVKKLYMEYTMADKVYGQIIQEINPEISDDEARTITVQHILIRTYYMDGEERVPYTETEKQEAYAKALSVYEEAVGGQDFEGLAVKYSEDDTITLSFRKGQVEKEFEDAAFALETNGISQVVATSEGYQIIKCINTFNREETDANKILIVEERRREVFNQEYDAFVKTLVRQLNEGLWDSVALIKNSQVRTDNFFDVYTKYFPQG